MVFLGWVRLREVKEEKDIFRDKWVFGSSPEGGSNYFQTVPVLGVSVLICGGS